MIKLLNRYQFLIIALLCVFNMSSAMAVNTDVNNSDNTTQAYVLDASDVDLVYPQIDHRENSHSNHDPSEAIEYEKNDEEESESLGDNLDFTPATLYAFNSNKFRNSDQEFEKVRWCTTPFAWNLHASRSIFFQVFRV